MADIVKTDPQATVNGGPAPVAIAKDEQEQYISQKVPSTGQYSIFLPWQKKLIVLLSSITAFISPLSAQIYLPALTAVGQDLGVDSTQVNLTITTYMIFQGICPMFIGSLADSGGRRPAYVFCFTVYIAANIGLALAPNFGSVLALRCLQSAGSSSTVALCTAVVADIVTSAERGEYVGYSSIAGVLAPAVGPVIGGLLSQHLGWRSIFWFLCIFAGLILIVVVVFLPETCRHIVGDGSISPPTIYKSVVQLLASRKKTEAATTGGDSTQSKEEFKFKAPNVLESLMMLFEKETSILLWSSSVVFAGFYAIAAAMPSQFQTRYGYDETKIGLMYLPLAAGSVVAAFGVGPAMNKLFQHYCNKLGVPYDRSREMDLLNFPIERARLGVGIPLLGLSGVTLIAWGWALNQHAHVAILCVLNAIIGIGLIGYNNTISALIVDLHPGKAGTVTAANNLTRCLVGAGASAAILPMIDAMSVGGAFSLITGFYFIMIFPLILVYKRGMKWRQEASSKKTEGTNAS